MKAKGYPMKQLILLGVILLAACSTSRTRVDCGGRLTPINAPAPVAGAVTARGLASTPAASTPTPETAGNHSGEVPR